MPPCKKHIFVCTNLRPNEPAGCCEPKGGSAIHARFKERIKEMGLAHEVRANKSGCLDACAHGPTVVIYPQGLWYGGVKLGDVDEIIDKSIIRDEVIERLRLVPQGPSGMK
jgi:(2Fe-2S) ferredoxin